MSRAHGVVALKVSQERMALLAYRSRMMARNSVPDAHRYIHGRIWRRWYRRLMPQHTRGKGTETAYVTVNRALLYHLGHSRTIAPRASRPFTPPYLVLLAPLDLSSSSGRGHDLINHVHRRLVHAVTKRNLHLARGPVVKQGSPSRSATIGWANS